MTPFCIKVTISQKFFIHSRSFCMYCFYEAWWYTVRDITILSVVMINLVFENFVIGILSFGISEHSCTKSIIIIMALRAVLVANRWSFFSLVVLYIFRYSGENNIGVVERYHNIFLTIIIIWNVHVFFSCNTKAF